MGGRDAVGTPLDRFRHWAARSRLRCAIVSGGPVVVVLGVAAAPAGLGMLLP